MAVFALWSCGPATRPAAATGFHSPERIVALTVGATDTLALLGQIGRVVAVEEDCFVPGTEHVVKLRNDDHAGPSKALSVEALLALHPDLILAKEDLKPVLEGRGVEVLWTPPDNDLEHVEALVRELGARLGVEARAREVLDEMHARRRSIEQRVSELPRVRVYYEAGKPGRSAGRRTIVGAMLELAGGENLAAASELANPTLSSEAIVAFDPEVIVLSPWSDAPEQVAQRPGWDRIAAVRNRRVHRVDERDRKFQYPSPSCVEGCDRLLVPWLHPSLAPGGSR